MREPDDTFTAPPDPVPAGSLDDLVERLRLLKVWAGDPSYEAIKDRVNAAWTAAGRPAGDLARKTTVVSCFRPGRRRVNTELVVAVVRALHPDPGYVAAWRQALRVVGGLAEAAAQVRVQDRLPPDLAGFTGRAAALRQLRHAFDGGTAEAGVVVISGMPGVGKTQLAVHAAHLFLRERAVERVLFVDLRGFHPDPAYPPADPAAVLDGFLRLLGVAGQQIPFDLPGRVAAYRHRLAGTRTVVLLDNAADVDQVRPLLPDPASCPVLITSRRRLTDLSPATHVTMDVFAPDESVAFLTEAATGIPTGRDPHALARIAGHCGHLPLALGLVGAHLRGTPGWTLTEHADRLDEHRDHRRLDAGVELALDLSYRHLPDGEQRLLRLSALHPGQEFDGYAAAALAGTDLTTARNHLDHLGRDHLLKPAGPDRYTFHDLVRAHATGRASDVDPPSARRAALTRLFDFYLATAATAMDALYPSESHRRPQVAPPALPMPGLTAPDDARAWLDTERPTLIAVTAQEWPTYSTRLSTTLFRYLACGYPMDALAVHGHARRAAHRRADPHGEADALTNLGVTHVQLGRYGPAADHLRQALRVFGETGDQAGRARALGNLGVIESQVGSNRLAADHHAQALALFRQAGHRPFEAHTMTNLGDAEGRLGRYGPATAHFRQALALFRQLGDRTGEAWALATFGGVEVRQGRYEQAGDCLRQALTLYRQLGDRFGEAWALDSLGTLHVRLGQPTGEHQQALDMFRGLGERHGEASALNGLGETAHATADPAGAVARHRAAHTIAVEVGDRIQQARAHTGLGHAHHTLGSPDRARQHYRQAHALYTDLAMPEADQIRARLVTIDDAGAPRLMASLRDQHRG